MTYNELTLLLLSHHHKLDSTILFRVSDISYNYALRDSDFTVNIVKYYSEYGVFADTRDITWKYTIPLLPNGTPLRILSYYESR